MRPLVVRLLLEALFPLLVVAEVVLEIQIVAVAVAVYCLLALMVQLLLLQVERPPLVLLIIPDLAEEAVR
jgi:hypothetical protein